MQRTRFLDIYRGRARRIACNTGQAYLATESSMPAHLLLGRRMLQRTLGDLGSNVADNLPRRTANSFLIRLVIAGWF